MHIVICSNLFLCIWLGFLVSAYRHLSVSVLDIWLCLPRLCILASAVFQFCLFLLISSSLHIYIYNTSVLFILLCFDCLWILKSAVFKFCVFFSFLPLYILTSALFQFSIFYFAFLFSTFWHLHPYFSSVSSSLFIDSCNHLVR